MVTVEEIRSKVFTKEFEELPEKVSMRVTANDVVHFDENTKKLIAKIRNKLISFNTERNLSKMNYTEFSNACDVHETTIKKVLSGRMLSKTGDGFSITRKFLYKLAVGLKMSVEEANEYFALCGGRLQEDCLGDYICIRALIDGDSLKLFGKQLW